MPSPAVYSAIRAHLEANWSTTAIYFENEERSPNEQQSWVFVEFSSSVYAQQSIGAETQAANRWDQDGSVFMTVHVPTGSGAQDAYAYAFGLAELFRGVTLMGDRLEFLDSTIGYGGPAEEGRFYQIGVNAGWRLVDA